MADWFKFFENDLDDERLQWAMSEQPHVGIVYVTILSRCCREKSSTLNWAGKDFELFALANKVHISPPLAQQCLSLLEQVQLIQINPGTLKVLRWNDRQSEYCQRKIKRVPTVSRHYPDNVPTVSPERRGEEIRLSPKGNALNGFDSKKVYAISKSIEAKEEECRKLRGAHLSEMAMNNVWDCPKAHARFKQLQSEIRELKLQL